MCWELHSNVSPTLGDLLLHMAVHLSLCCCSRLEELRPETTARSCGPALLPPWSLSPWVHTQLLLMAT